MRVRLLTLDDEPTWNSALSRFSNVQFAHNPAFRRVVEESLGLESEYLWVESEGQLKALCPLIHMRSLLHLFRPFLISAPFVTSAGILAETDEARDFLLDYLHQKTRESNLTVQLRNFPSNRIPELAESKAYVTLTLDLEPYTDESSYLATLSSRNRNKIRKARKNGVSTVFGGADLLQEFYRLYFRAQRGFGTPPYPFSFFSSLLKCFGEVEIGLALYQQVPVAAVFNIGFQKTMHYVYAGSDKETRRLYPNNLLFFEMIARALDRGYECFDFGRSEIGSGTFRFKEQWRPQIQQLSYQYLGFGSEEIATQSISGVRASLAFRVFHQLWSAYLPDWAIRLLSPQLIKRMPLA